jgi:NAD(P)-dependent dehydrogenase (short-subunit alcohol dehydrogenase family)
MAQNRFLVTGATGDTGGYTVEQLLERGHAVRALAHREDDRSKRLEKMGSVAKNILATFYSGKESILATISCVVSEFLQQSPVLNHYFLKTTNSSLLLNKPHDARHSATKTAQKSRAPRAPE